VCAMNHSCVRHDSMQSFVVGTVTDSCVCHDSFTCVPSLIHACAMTHSCVRHDSMQSFVVGTVALDRVRSTGLR